MAGSDNSRGSDGRFAAGNRFGPGRRVGSMNRATAAAMSLLAGEVQALTRKCIAMALGGDGMAMKLCLERLVPPPKAVRYVRMVLPVIASPADLVEASSALTSAVAGGEIAL